MLTVHGLSLVKSLLYRGFYAIIFYGEIVQGERYMLVLLGPYDNGGCWENNLTGLLVKTVAITRTQTS